MDIKRLFADTPVARYNITAWEKADVDTVVLVGREVEKPGEKGEPDIGKLVLVEMDDQYNVIHERIIWEPQHDGFFLEDPRALMLPEGTIVIGLTAAIRKSDGFVPFPAIVRIDSKFPWEEELPPVMLIQSFGPGKNLTPISANKFLFRPDSKEYYHKILLFGFDRMTPQKIQDLEFPTDLSWGKWRIGTTMPPVWINENEALLIIHGINYDDDKFIYSLGRGKLFRKGDKFEVTVAPDPILTPDSFIDEKGQPLVEELHPHLRRVVYSVGGIVKRKKEDTLYLYVNVGDRATYEVAFSLEDLKTGLF